MSSLPSWKFHGRFPACLTPSPPPPPPLTLTPHSPNPVVQYFLSPLLLKVGFIPALLSNALYAAAFTYYHYLTFLGYDGTEPKHHLLRTSPGLCLLPKFVRLPPLTLYCKAGLSFWHTSSYLLISLLFLFVAVDREMYDVV